MKFSTRISSILHHEMPDQVPYAPYDDLVPRGDFARQLLNRGMGLSGAMNEAAEKAFKASTLALMDAIEKFEDCPITAG